MNEILSIMKKRNLHFTFPIFILGLLLLVACSSNREAETNSSEPETGSFTDARDGKTYKTVKVGDQWIMAENLAHKPENGNYWAYDNDENNIAIYGYLYDYETAMKIAPKGWHLPSRKEWAAIHKELGAKRTNFKYYEIIYPKMIVGGSSGLDMLFGGLRTCKGEFQSLGDIARFWTSSILEGKYNAFTGLNKNKDQLPHGLGLSKAPYMHHNGYQSPCPGYNVRLFNIHVRYLLFDGRFAF